MIRFRRSASFALAAMMSVAFVACGSDEKTTPVTKPGGGSGDKAKIVLAVNPWTGSAVNANVAKVVIESKLSGNVTLKAIDETATWPGLDSGQIDAVLEVWPSGHAKDRELYIDGKKSVADIGLLGPQAKIGWYIPTALLEKNPELSTWEGFKTTDAATLFKTAESGDKGQFLMGDPSYVSYDEQIIENLELPFKFVVAGSEAAQITAINKAIADDSPLLLQFWQPHWLHSKVKLTEVKLPAVTEECTASAAAKDGKYACDYPVDPLYKAASSKLEAKSSPIWNFLKKIQLTTEQQNEIAAMIDGDKMKPLEAAQKWVDANADVVAGWLAA